MINPDFRDFINSQAGDHLTGLLPALEQEPSVSVRFNPLKTPKAPPHPLLDGAPVPWEQMGRYVDLRPSFTLDPALHQGLYYVQEASSMIVGEIVRRIAASENNMPLAILDSCAAPGGKTTAVAAAMPPGSALIANEYDFRRAEILRENVAKWGHPAVAVARGDTARFTPLKGLFSVIVADMPCSGEGMMRKDPEAGRQWTPALVEQCARRQRQIADNLLPALAPGGYFIYSTCTFNTTENERNVERIALTHGLETVPPAWPAQWNIAPSLLPQVDASRLMPHLLRGEGLFVAVLRKPGTLTPFALPAKTKPLRSPAADMVAGLTLRREADTIWGATAGLAGLVDITASKAGPLLAPGTEIAQMKGKDLVPAHPLALSAALRTHTFNTVDIDTEAALSFLRRDNMALPPATPKGHILLTHNSLPLGFVKNLGNRTNNLMPKEWRIRH